MVLLILILKIRKLKSVRGSIDTVDLGGGSTIDIEAIDVEVINAEAIDTVDPGGIRD